MCLIHDHEVRRVIHEMGAVPLGLDEIDAGHQVAVVLVDGQVLVGRSRSRRAMREGCRMAACRANFASSSRSHWTQR